MKVYDIDFGKKEVQNKSRWSKVPDNLRGIQIKSKIEGGTLILLTLDETT